MKPNAPWFDSEYKILRRKRRKAEKKYKKTKALVDKAAFIKLRKETKDLFGQQPNLMKNWLTHF